MASESAQLEAISVGRCRRRSRDNFERSNSPEAVTESEHNSVHDSLNGGVEETETKRPRSSSDNVDGPAPLNGQLEEELECLEPVKATAETTTEEPASNDNEKTDPGSAEEPEQPNAESEKELSNITREDSAEGQTGSDTQILSRKMEIPDDMVGVLKDKAEDTVLSPLENLGAKILVGYADANPLSTSRHFEPVGISDIGTARLIKNLIAKADAGDSPSLVARGFSTDQVASASEQREVSFQKGGVQIGKARYTIQCLLDNTFGKIQILSDADKVELFGTLENIKWTERLIKDVIAKANADGSPSLVAQGSRSVQAASAGEQREVSVEKADAGGSPKLVAPVFSMDQTASAGEQREVSVDKTDDGDLPSPVAQGFSEAASAGEQCEVSFEMDDVYISYIRKGEPPVPISACRVDVYARHFLGIDEHGDYYSSAKPVEIPQKYCIKLEEELYGLRKFRVEKHGESTYDIVMVGCLNIYKYNTWIAGDTLKFEEPDYVKDTPVFIDPLALTFPAHMTVDEYKKKDWDSYKEMVKDKLTSAMRKADLNPADYGVDDDLCLSLVGDGERDIILDPDDYPCEFCGSEGDCTCALESESEPVSESESESE